MLIRQTITMLAAVMGAVLLLFSWCLQQVDASELLPSAGLPEIRARVSLPSPLDQSDVLSAVESLIETYPETFATPLRAVLRDRDWPALASRDGASLIVTFESKPSLPLTDLATIRTQIWEGDELLATLPLTSLIALEGCRVIATRALPRGIALTADDLQLAWVPLAGRAGQSALADPALLIGMTPVRPLTSGTLLELRQMQEPLLVMRGATVRVSVTRGGITLETSAVALQTGSRGALIKLQRPDSKTTLIARVTGLNTAVVD